VHFVHGFKNELFLGVILDKIIDHPLDFDSKIGKMLLFGLLHFLVSCLLICECPQLAQVDQNESENKPFCAFFSFSFTLGGLSIAFMIELSKSIFEQVFRDFEAKKCDASDLSEIFEMTTPQSGRLTALKG